VLTTNFVPHLLHSTAQEMSIQDDVAKLTPASLENYLRKDPSSIDSSGGKINMTPLAAACKGGYLDAVRLLLSRGAKPNTPSLPDNYTSLFYAIAQRPHPNRLAIIQALISVKPDLDVPCNGKHTPLLIAITQSRDEEIVHLLVDSNASVDEETKKHAKKYKMDVRPKAERNSTRAMIVNLVVSLVQLVIAYTNEGFVKNIVGGVTKKLHLKQLLGISGSKDNTLKTVLTYRTYWLAS